MRLMKQIYYGGKRKDYLRIKKEPHGALYLMWIRYFESSLNTVRFYSTILYYCVQ